MFLSTVDDYRLATDDQGRLTQLKLAAEMVASDDQDTNMGDGTWGHLADGEGFGRVGDRKEDYPVISFVESKAKYTKQTHAAHAMLWARSDRVLWDLYNARAAVMMQMRFDGLIGFPGGIVDPGEEPVVGLNRELHEEIHLDLDKYSLTDDNHLRTFYHAKKNLVLHFFAKEVTLEQFTEIEKDSLLAYEHGIETMGSIRPPLFTMGDNMRGFPAFLTNHFCGNAKEELFLGLSTYNILTNDEIHKANMEAEQFLRKR